MAFATHEDIEHIPYQVEITGRILLEIRIKKKENQTVLWHKRLYEDTMCPI